MKRVITLLLPLILVMTACSPIENNARNTASALQGTIVAAQTKWQSSCMQDNTQKACQDINRAVSAQNALITSIETYCGLSPSSPPADMNAKCVPVKSAQSALQAAINNATQLIGELKGAL